MPKFIKYLAMTAFIAAVLTNLSDIRRYIRISTM